MLGALRRQRGRTISGEFLGINTVSATLAALDPEVDYWPDGVADIFDIQLGCQQRSDSEADRRRRSGFRLSVAPASLYLA